MLAARPATKYASRAAQNMELSKHARINLNELGIEQEMKKVKSVATVRPRKRETRNKFIRTGRTRTWTLKFIES